MVYRPLLIGTFNTVSFLKLKPFICHQKGWYPLKPSIISFYFPTCNGLHLDIHLVFNSFHHSCCFKRPENTHGNTQILTPSFQVQIHKSCGFFLTQLWIIAPWAHGPNHHQPGHPRYSWRWGKHRHWPRGGRVSARPDDFYWASSQPGKTRGQLVVKIMGILVMYMYIYICIYNPQETR